MAFLLKVFSGSERLMARQKSAALVNETFQAELSDVQTKVEVENYELQMLVEMIYDSSYPESQKFLKQPSKDRLYAHKEIISSLLFGFAAQGVSVAPLILTHFQKHGCDDISDTLLTLLDLVRPLLDSRDVPLFTSDDILDAIDAQWHSSVRSSPAFASLRGSTTASPLQSPRVSFSIPSSRQGSFSNLSPRQSLSPRELESVSSPVSPFTTHANRLTDDFSFSPPSEGVRAAAPHEAPRRSLSFQYPGSERLQPLVEHEEEIGTRNVRKDAEDVAPLHSSSLNVDTGEFGKGLSIHIPRSSTSFKVEEFNGDRTQDADEEREVEKVAESVRDVDAEVPCEIISESETVPSSLDRSEHEDFVVSLPTATQPHVEDSEQTVLKEELHSCDHDSREESFRYFATVHSSGVDMETGELGTGLPIGIPQRVTSVEVEEFNGDEAQVADEEPTLEVSHERFDESVGDVDNKVLWEGILESEALPSSRNSSNHEVSETDIIPIKHQVHVGDSDQTSMGMSHVADEEPKLEYSHEQFYQSVGHVDKVLCEGFSVGILESEAVPSSREVSEKDITPIKDQFHAGVSDQTSVAMNEVTDEEPRLEFPHEQFYKSVGDGDTEVLREGFSEGILESEAVPSSRDSSDHEVSEKGITPIKDQFHVGDSDQTRVGMNQVAGEERRLENSREQFDKSVGDADAELQCEGFSGGHAGILVESELAVPSSGEVSEKGIVASPPAKSHSYVEDSKQGFEDGQSVERTQQEFSNVQSYNEVEFQKDSAAKDILEERDQVSSCDLSNHEDVVALSIRTQCHVEDSEPTAIPDANVEEFNSTDNSLISKAGMEEDVPTLQDAMTTQLKSEEYQGSKGSLSESSNGRAASLQGVSFSAQGTEVGSSSWSENSTPIKGDLKDNIQNEMDKLAEELSLVTNEAEETVEKDGAMEFAEVKGVNEDGAKEGLEEERFVEGVEEDGEIMGEGGLMRSAGDVVVEEDGAKEGVEEDRAVEGVKGDGAVMEGVEEDGEILEEGGLVKSEEADVVERGVKEDGAKESVEEEGFVEEGGLMKSAGEVVPMEEDRAKEGVESDRVVEGGKEDGAIMEGVGAILEGGLMKSVDQDVFVGGVEEDATMMEGVEDKGVGEAEFQDQEPASDPRSCIAQSKTDMVSQSSFSDHDDGDETTTSSSDEGTSSSSGDEEAMPVEKKKKKNHQFSRQISPELEREHPERQLYGAVALHSPSYNLVTFDLTKLLLSTNHKDIQGGVIMDESTFCPRENPSSEAKQMTLPPALEEGEDFSQSHADLVASGSTSLQKADIPMKQESNGAEVFEGEIPQRHDSAALDKLRVSRGDNEVTKSGENPSLCEKVEEDEEALITLDSARTGSEDSSKSENRLDGGDVMVSTESEDPVNDVKERDSLASSTINEQEKIPLLSDQVDGIPEGDSPESESETPGEEGVSRVEKEKDSLVHFDEGEEEGEVEGQDIKQVLEGVNYQASSVQENGPSTLDAHVDESGSHPFGDLDDKKKDLAVMSPSQGDIKQVLNHDESSQENGVIVRHIDEVMKGAVVSKLSECGLKDVEMKDVSTQLSEEADDETKRMSSGEGCKRSDGISSMQRDDKTQMENPHTLDKEKDVELVTGSATDGVFLHNTKFLDSQGDFVRALTTPEIVARHGETEPERRSIRDSLICTPASNFDGSVKTHKNGWPRRYNFLLKWCCSKPTVL